MFSRFSFKVPFSIHTFLQRRSLYVKSFDNKQITISFQDGTEAEDGLVSDTDVSFSTVFLRDACSSPNSVDPSTKQKSFTTANICKDLQVSGPPSILHENGQDFLKIQWKHPDGSTQNSTYSSSFLLQSRNVFSRMEGKFLAREKSYWAGRDLIKNMNLLNFDYRAYLEGEDTFTSALRALNRYGICFVNKVENPLQNPKTQLLTQSNWMMWPVAKLATNFGYVKSTFYGTLFDVKNDKNAKNIANTNAFLPLHMDLCYYESPPGLQLLHFIQNSTLGGENVFADSFLAATHVKNSDPEAYEALKKVPITFHYNNNNEYYYYLRPLIVEEPYLRNFETDEALIKEVNYSPPFQGPFEMHITDAEDPKLFGDFLRGMACFEEFVNDRINQYIIKFPENSCVIFDNRRVLHSRLEFSDKNGGDRWLMGCYVDGDSFRSKLSTRL